MLNIFLWTSLAVDGLSTVLLKRASFQLIPYCLMQLRLYTSLFGVSTPEKAIKTSVKPITSLATSEETTYTCQYRSSPRKKD